MTAADGASPVDVAGLLADLEAKYAAALANSWGVGVGFWAYDVPEALPTLLRLARAGEALRTGVLAEADRLDARAYALRGNYREGYEKGQREAANRIRSIVATTWENR